MYLCCRRRNMSPKPVTQAHVSQNAAYEDQIHNDGVQPNYQPYQPQPQSTAVENRNMNINENCAVITPAQVGFENPPPYNPHPSVIGFGALDNTQPQPSQPPPMWQQTSGLPINGNFTSSPQAGVHYPPANVDDKQFLDEPPPYPGVNDNTLSQNAYVPVSYKSESVA